MRSRDYYTASRLTSEQVGQCDSWEFPSVTKRLGLEHKNVLPADFDRDRKELERHIEESRKLAYEEGFNQGKFNGHAEGMAILMEKAKIFDSLLLSFEVGVKGLDHIFEEQIVRLSIEIAKAVIRHELKTNQKQIEKVVKEALNCLPKHASGIKLHMHTEDIDLLKETLDAEILGKLKNLNFIADENLTRGGCILEAEDSYMDATVEARLKAVLTEVNSEDHVTTNN
jgi:flagellar assembly protein FliH